MDNGSKSGQASSTASYGLVFLILGVFTALEVVASTAPDPYRLPLLIVLAAIKAGLVLLYFMHLKVDRRTYALAFVIGLLVVIPLVLAFTFATPHIHLPPGLGQ